MQAITAMPFNDFKSWVKDGAKNKPLAKTAPATPSSGISSTPTASVVTPEPATNEAWTRMPHAERLALTTKTGMAKLVADKIARTAWADITPKTRDRITAAQEVAPTAPAKSDYTPAERETIGKSFLERIKTDPTMVDQYVKQFGNVIDPDYAKKMMPEYQVNPEQFTQTAHEGSSILAKKVYQHYLDTLPKGSDILFSAGGGGSGKTATIGLFKKSGNQRFGLTYDATLSDLLPSKMRINDALNSGHKVTIVYTNRDSLDPSPRHQALRR